MKNTNFATQQEAFWASEFGTEYVNRNASEQLLASNINLFSNALRVSRKISSCIELGANIGMNLKALQLLYPGIELRGIEINPRAASQLRRLIGNANVYEGSIQEYSPENQADLVLVKGVLIHINPDTLDAAYEKIYLSSGRYILLCEYYNPSPVSIPYRGHSDRLFKRDFAGEMLDAYTELKLVDYGFVYHRDHAFPQDDVTWFLMEKEC